MVNKFLLRLVRPAMDASFTFFVIMIQATTSVLCVLPSLLLHIFGSTEGSRVLHVLGGADLDSPHT